MLGGSSKGWTISIKRHIAIIWVWDMSPDFILKLSGVVNVAVIFDWKKYHDYDFKWLSCLNQWQILNEGFVFIIYCILITNQDQYIFFLILIKKVEWPCLCWKLADKAVALRRMLAMHWAEYTITVVTNERKHTWLLKMLGWKELLKEAIIQPTSSTTKSHWYFQTLVMSNAPYC